MPPFLFALRFAACLTVVLAIIIAALTLMPPGQLPPVGGSDKLHHALAFAALAYPLCCVQPRWQLRVLIGVIVFGGAIELIQPSVGRTAEWGDLAADAIGALLGLLAAAVTRAAYCRWRAAA